MRVDAANLPLHERRRVTVTWNGVKLYYVVSADDVLGEAVTYHDPERNPPGGELELSSKSYRMGGRPIMCTYRGDVRITYEMSRTEGA